MQKERLTLRSAAVCEDGRVKRYCNGGWACSGAAAIDTVGQSCELKHFVGSECRRSSR